MSPNGQPPPMAGAVDLGALKGAAPRELAEQSFAQTLIQQGIVCQCGERIRDQGVMVYLRKDNAIPSPQGNLPGLAQLAVHSLECSVYHSVVAEPGVTLICIRRTTEILWPDEMEESI